MSFRFRHLLKQHQDQVYTLCCYLLRDASEAEDVTQETFIKLWDRIDQIGDEQARAWLMKVARNACLDRLRKRRPESQLDDHMLQEKSGPQTRLEQQQLGSWLKQAIAGLREPYRSLVVLRDVQQNSYQEVADTLELNLGQVKVYLHRARRQLRQSLQESMA